jgi:hypothetical protein
MAADGVELSRVERGGARGLSIGYDDESAALVKSLRALPAALRKNIALAIRDSARMVAADAKDLLGGSKARGRRYKVGPLRAVIVTGSNDSSAPGAPPAQQSGELRRSIRVQRQRRDGLAYRVETEFYALFLEGGATGPGRRRLEPRPFLSIALANRRDMIEAAIGEQVERALAEIREGATS